MNMHEKNTILITCGQGIAPYLERELKDLGYAINSSHRTGAEITAALTDAMKLNLWLRTALNVLWLLKKFDCLNPEELYEHVASIAWEEFIPAEEYISVVSFTETPTIKNSMFANQKVKDAIVDRMAKKTGKRPLSGPERDNIVINLFWKGPHCWLYLNTSGRKLSDRGYRKFPYKAPLQETLAAAIVLETGYNGQNHLVNPMCGSATLAIEAALIGLNRAPGLLRKNFAFMHLKNFNEKIWKGLCEEAAKKSKNTLAYPIIASDIDKDAIVAAKKNAVACGVERLIEFHLCDFRNTPIAQNKGIIVINPAYGKRMGEISRLEQTYKEIGDYFKQKCAGYTGYIFTGNLPLAKRVGLRTSAKIMLFNADIECRLLKYELYEGSKNSPS